MKTEIFVYIRYDVMIQVVLSTTISQNRDRFVHSVFTPTFLSSKSIFAAEDTIRLAIEYHIDDHFPINTTVIKCILAHKYFHYW